MKKLSILLILAISLIACNETKETKVESTELTTEEKTDKANIKKIFDSALLHGKSYEWLRDLTSNIGGRMSGSPEAAKAVIWGERVMKESGIRFCVATTSNCSTLGSWRKRSCLLHF